MQHRGSTMRSSLSPNVSRRWYFTNNTEDVGMDNPTEPVTLWTGEDKVWSNKGSLKDVPAGWYWVVFCISFDTLDLGQLSTMLFDAKRGNAMNHLNLMKHTCKTQLRPDEIQNSLKARALEGGGLLRLRLHRQIEVIKEEEYLYLTIGARIRSNLEDTMPPQSFTLHYVELGTNRFLSPNLNQSIDHRDDYVVYGDGCPHQMIAVDRYNKERGEKAAATKIRTYGISDKAEFAVTLHLRETLKPTNSKLTGATKETTINIEPTVGLAAAAVVSATVAAAAAGANIRIQPHIRVQGVISVWDLRSPNGNIDNDVRALSAWETLPYLNPCAEIGIGLPEKLDTHEAWDNFCASISISTHGSKVVLGGIETTCGILPFAVYDCKHTGRTNKIGEPRSIEVTTKRRCKELKEFSGHGLFHRVDPTKFDVSDDNDNERFVAFNGSVLEVYSIKSSGWRLLQHITLSHRLDIYGVNCYAIVQSLRGRYFAWTGDPGVVSIWDMEKGKPLSNIFVSMDKSPIYAVLSPDGTKVAISVKRTVQIHESSTGILLGVHSKGVVSDNNSEVVLGNEYFVVRDNSLSPHEPAKVRSVVRIKDMEVVKSASTSLHDDYHITYPLASMTTIAAYKQGSVLNIKRLTGIETPRVRHPCGDAPCEPNKVLLDEFVNNKTFKYTSVTREVFHAKCRQEYHTGCLNMILEISVDGHSYDPLTSTKSMVHFLGHTFVPFRGFYLPESSKLVIFAEGYMKIWTLSSSAAHICQLDYIWGSLSYEPERSADYCHRPLIKAWACPHGTSMKFHLRKPVWYKNHIVVDGDLSSDLYDVLTVPPRKKDETVKTTEAERLEYGIFSLIDEYRNGDHDSKNSITRYLLTCIRASTLNPVSCLVPLCKAWSPKNRDLLLELVGALLPKKEITWIPDPKAAKSMDPLAALLTVAKDKRSAIVLIRVLVEYCFAHTTESKNLTFLSPLFASMPGIMEYYREDALEYIGRIAYIPTNHPTYIWKNHVPYQKIAPFRFPLWNFIRCVRMSRSDIRREANSNPIMQFKFKTDTDGDNEDNLEKPVFMATFDALWFYRNRDEDSKKQVQGGDAYGKGDCGGEKGSVGDRQRLSRLMSTFAFSEGLAQDKTTWWKALYPLVLGKFLTYSPPVIECHDFSLEFLDNPAIVALVTFKWETIGFVYWFQRFFCQCIYYILVVAATLAQVYHPEPSKLYGIFVTIIVIGVAFVYLEILQAIRDVRRHVTSPYNLVDAFAFILPPVASAMQLHFIRTQDTTGNNRALSFSVLVIFIHIVLELRISRSVCKYVSIIQRAVSEIYVFLVIVAGCIMAFNITILHMLRSCPYEGCTRDITKYPIHFLGGLSTTVFFLSGRFDAVSDELDASKSKDWAFQLVMFTFLISASILMMNVLIALINVAFTKGDDRWRLMWIQSRLRYIESAENMSYLLPGFRLNYELFPNQIYFTATDKDQKAYLKKHPKSRHEEDNKGEPEPLKARFGRNEDEHELTGVGVDRASLNRPRAHHVPFTSLRSWRDSEMPQESLIVRVRGGSDNSRQRRGTTETGESRDGLGITEKVGSAGKVITAGYRGEDGDRDYINRLLRKKSKIFQPNKIDKSPSSPLQVLQHERRQLMNEEEVVVEGVAAAEAAEEQEQGQEQEQELGTKKGVEEEASGKALDQKVIMTMLYNLKAQIDESQRQQIRALEELRLQFTQSTLPS
ncbi:MAG: hypothetical protein J3R72DRAFT_248371 [Linnemannia gamsii]|nr:MAG: hypothetical protein J3R72DRAFT_248371 [Linnemannia gamsii]